MLLISDLIKKNLLIWNPFMEANNMLTPRLLLLSYYLPAITVILDYKATTTAVQILDLQTPEIREKKTKNKTKTNNAPFLFPFFSFITCSFIRSLARVLAVKRRCQVSAVTQPRLARRS